VIALFRARRPSGVLLLSVLAIVLATAAVVLAVVALTRPVPVAPTSPTGTRPNQTVRLPNLVGLSEQVAVARAQRVGLNVSVSVERSSVVPQGEIISESPESGALVAPGSTIILVESGGP